MAAASSSFIPTPLALADNQGERAPEVAALTKYRETNFRSLGLCKQNVQLFSVSTHRSVIVLQYVENSKDSELVVKRVNDTRWCTRADVTTALSKCYSSFQKALQIFAEDMTQKLQVIHEAKCLIKDLLKKENIIRAGFWAVVLRRINEGRWKQHSRTLIGGFMARREPRVLTLEQSDEAHFWLNGYVNKQNCRIGSEPNPQVYVETPLHPEKLTVWCALWDGGIIGPYFFKNDEGHNVTVNGDRYRAMITNFLIPELNNLHVQELWFQQDGATCHTARATIDSLKNTFGDRPISRFGPVNWPPRSCDLTPLDYFLWGYVKSLVYADKPQTLDHLEDNIRRVIADILPQMMEKLIKNWTSRLDYIRASRGSPMPEIIFKT
ncbi:putative transposable element [Trichonephila clavipes]|nr:putative transposable element [Trichonephila clavipes]